YTTSVPSLTLQHFTIICFLLFFLTSSPPHRDLHSFPTRRSSDLRRASRSPRQHLAPGFGDQHVVFDAHPAKAGHISAGFDREHQDRKSTRLNSSHLGISYAVFCLKKKKKKHKKQDNDNYEYLLVI